MYLLEVQVRYIVLHVYILYRSWFIIIRNELYIYAPVCLFLNSVDRQESVSFLSGRWKLSMNTCILLNHHQSFESHKTLSNHHFIYWIEWFPWFLAFNDFQCVLSTNISPTINNNLIFFMVFHQIFEIRIKKKKLCTKSTEKINICLSINMMYMFLRQTKH